MAKTCKSRTWRVGFYIRLSREDARGGGESESVHNQRLILTDWLNNQCDGDQYILAGEFIDDGVSGTTDEERPGFQRLLRSIEAGAVNCVVVKNLARSFRNHADQGYYLEDWFIVHRVRFVSLYQQPVDTYKDPFGATNIGVPVQGVLNESHARDTSENVRRTFDKKRERGLHIGSFAAYGYRKDPGDKNALVIDGQAAEVVREIFSWFLDGDGKNAIARTLNERGVPCPSLYKQSQGLKYRNPHAENRPLWSAKTVGEMLKNRLYVGDMVQGRHRMRSYKIHIQDAVPEDEWFIVENTHEPIIGRERFAQVQKLLKRGARTAPGNRNPYPFSGFLRCADCGRAMCRSAVKGTVYYFCRTYKEQSKAACTKHSVKHNLLETAVLFVLQQQLYLASAYPEAITRLNRAPVGKGGAKRLNDLIAAKERERIRAARYRQSLYQDWKDGNLTKCDYQQMYEGFSQQIADIDAAIGNLTAERAMLEKGADAQDPFLEAYRQHETIGRLTRDILIEFVEHVEVFENGCVTVKLKHCDGILRSIEQRIRADSDRGPD